MKNSNEKSLKHEERLYKIGFVSYSLARLDIKDVRHNKFAMIILSYYDINM